jgi:hypothetical protein
MPSTAQRAQEQNASTERSPLLGVQRENLLDYATHIPEDALVTDHEHYNLAGLSQADFWILVSCVE